jgi:hypothetical protein
VPTRQLIANPKSRILLPLLAAVAVVAAFAVSSTSAPAASGGLGTGGTVLADSGTKTNKAKSKRKAKYRRLWRRAGRRHKRWARRTAQCESGRNPKAIGGGGLYRGAFQFTRPTWRRSPKSPGGDPIRYPYRTQAVVAIALKKRDGAGHWPHCG